MTAPVVTVRGGYTEDEPVSGVPDRLGGTTRDQTRPWARVVPVALLIGAFLLGFALGIIAGLSYAADQLVRILI